MPNKLKKKNSRVILAYLYEDAETPDHVLLDEGQNFSKLFRDFTKQDNAYAKAVDKPEKKQTAADKRAIKSHKGFTQFITDAGVKSIKFESYFVGGA